MEAEKLKKHQRTYRSTDIIFEAYKKYPSRDTLSLISTPPHQRTKRIPPTTEREETLRVGKAESSIFRKDDFRTQYPLNLLVSEGLFSVKHIKRKDLYRDRVTR
jgi:hypothetical protein